MLQFVEIDIFDTQCEALVNPVNCKGFMGAGLAKIFKIKYPEMFDEYKKLCKSNSIQIGRLHFWRNPLNNPKWVINFPTKDDWKNPSKLEYISLGLKHLNKLITDNKIKSLAIPALGCGLGGLNWDNVKAVIEESLLDMATKEVDRCEILVAKPGVSL